jgi:hypothetical protein
MVNCGLVVWVGKEFFEGIDAVPNLNVKLYPGKNVGSFDTSI